MPCARRMPNMSRTPDKKLLTPTTIVRPRCSVPSPARPSTCWPARPHAYLQAPCRPAWTGCTWTLCTPACVPCRCWHGGSGTDECTHQSTAHSPTPRSRWCIRGSRPSPGWAESALRGGGVGCTGSTGQRGQQQRCLPAPTSTNWPERLECIKGSSVMSPWHADVANDVTLFRLFQGLAQHRVIMTLKHNCTNQSQLK